MRLSISRIVFGTALIQRKRWLKVATEKKCECVAVRRPGRVETPETRNDHRLFEFWFGFTLSTRDERFESGFRDLTLCVKVLRGSGARVLPPQEIL